MTVTPATGQLQSRRTIKPIVLDAAAVEYAIRLIHQVCCFAGSFDLINEFHDPALSAAVARHTPRPCSTG